MNITSKILIISTLALTLHSCNLFSAVGIGSQGQPIVEVTGTLNTTIQNSEVQVDHSLWDALLKKYVNDEGIVDYKNFLNERGKLKSYLQMLSVQHPTEAWSVEELLAYYINTYNAYTVDLILENYPVQSIKDIRGAWTKGIVPIGDETLSLGGVEHGVLRKMNEPRIHFAINCASYSCPKLLNEAFTADNMEEQLEKVTFEFINSDKNDIDAENPSLSSIFDWYEKDFKVNGKKNVIAYINRYSSIKINSDAKIRYKEYDWNLNE